MIKHLKHKFVLKKKGKKSILHVNGKVSDAVALNYNKGGSGYTLGHF